MPNVIIKEEPIVEEDIDEEEDFIFSMEITPEEAADAKVILEEVFDWSDTEHADDGDDISYWR